MDINPNAVDLERPRRQLKWRNYFPQTPALQVGVQQRVTTAAIEAQIEEIIKQNEKGLDQKEWMLPTAKKKNWDIKRDFNRKLMSLDQKTEAAMQILIRRQVLEAQAKSSVETKTPPEFLKDSRTDIAGENPTPKTDIAGENGNPKDNSRTQEQESARGQQQTSPGRSPRAGSPAAGSPRGMTGSPKIVGSPEGGPSSVSSNQPARSSNPPASSSSANPVAEGNSPRGSSKLGESLRAGAEGGITGEDVNTIAEADNPERAAQLKQLGQQLVANAPKMGGGSDSEPDFGDEDDLGERRV